MGANAAPDHAPVVKFFNPLGEGIWLATELNDDGDTLSPISAIPS